MEARHRGTYLHFALVYADPHAPTYKMRQIGSVCTGRKSNDDIVTLKSAQFQIGDYVDVAVAPPAGLVMEREIRERDRREHERDRDRERMRERGRPPRAGAADRQMPRGGGRRARPY